MEEDMKESVQRDSISVDPKPGHQAKVKKMLRELINDAEIVHVAMDRETFEFDSLSQMAKKMISSATETMTIRYRRSEKTPKFNAKEVQKDRRAIGKVLVKKK